MKKVYIAASFAYADRAKTESRKIDIERIVGRVKEKLNADFNQKI